MRSREEVVLFLKSQVEDCDYVYSHRKHHATHYGLTEIRDLLDYIYERPPAKEEEKITGFFNWRV